MSKLMLEITHRSDVSFHRNQNISHLGQAYKQDIFKQKLQTHRL